MSSDQGLLLQNDRHLGYSKLELSEAVWGVDDSSNPEFLDCRLYDAKLGRVCVDVVQGFIRTLSRKCKTTPWKAMQDTNHWVLPQIMVSISCLKWNVSCLVMSNSTPLTVAHQAFCPGSSLGKGTGVDCHVYTLLKTHLSLLIFQIQMMEGKTRS